MAQAIDIPEGERKIVTVDALSIGVFHHKGQWIALRNSCLHRGGPVCTGSLVDDTLTCPWHGFQYNVNSGQLLVDPSAFLDSAILFCLRRVTSFCRCRMLAALRRLIR